MHAMTGKVKVKVKVACRMFLVSGTQVGDTYIILAYLGKLDILKIFES